MKDETFTRLFQESQLHTNSRTLIFLSKIQWKHPMTLARLVGAVFDKG